MNGMHLFTLTTLAMCAALSGCAANSPFPPEVTDKVSPTFHFEAWRDASPTNEAGKSDAGIKVTCPRLLYHIPCESRRIAAPEVPWPREPAGDCPTRCAGESGCRCAASVR